MSVLAFIGRILWETVNNPGVQDVLTSVGKYATRQATAALIRRINQSTRIPKNPPTIR